MPVLFTRPLAAAAALMLAVSTHSPSIAAARSRATAHNGVSPPADSAPRSMAFDAQFIGHKVDRAGLVWHGRIRGPRGDDVTLTLEPLCTPLASAEAVWPVRVRWTDEGAAAETVAIAELEGIVDWKTGRLHVDGTVVEGSAKGRQVTLRAVFRNFDPTGVLSIVSQRATAGRSNGARTAGAAGAAPPPVIRPPALRQSADRPAAPSRPATPSSLDNTFNG